MKRSVLLLLLVLLPSLLFPQVVFQPGYIITNDHQKKTCQIANYGSEHTSGDYYYRFARKDSAVKIDIRYIEAFATGNKKFYRAKVLLETSPSHLTTDSVPPLRWEEQYVFIQKLFEGELASLYFYDDAGVFHFFLGLPDQPLIPLIYKRYVVQLTPNEPSSILENNHFREQLEEKLSCPALKEDLDKLSYTRKQMIRYFQDVHDCRHAKYKVYEHVDRGKLNFKASLLLSLSDFTFDDNLDFTARPDFGHQSTFSGGMEMEYLIPHNRYKLSLFAEANYVYYHASLPDPVSGQSMDIHFQYVEIPLGLNYYFILKNEHKLFLRAGVVPGVFAGENYLRLYSEENRYELNMVTTVFVGGGYRFKRLSLEYRYYTKQNQLQDVYRYNSTFTRMAFVMKFSFWEPGKEW